MDEIMARNPLPEPDHRSSIHGHQPHTLRHRLDHKPMGTSIFRQCDR